MTENRQSLNDQNSPITKIFSEVAMKMAAKVADYSEDHTSKVSKNCYRKKYLVNVRN